MSRLSRLSFAVALAGIATGCALIMRPAARQIIPGAFRMHGVYARAGAVALNDHIERERREAEAYKAHKIGSESDPDSGVRDDVTAAGSQEQDGGTEPVALESCFSRPEAYDVEVHFDKKRELYVVAVVPVPEVCLGEQGFAFVGGGAKYLIGAQVFDIIERTPVE
jgi:hypothetical protein